MLHFNITGHFYYMEHRLHGPSRHLVKYMYRLFSLYLDLSFPSLSRSNFALQWFL